MRQIFLLILLFFAGIWAARKIRHAQARAARTAAPPQTSDPSALRAEPMICCAECGVYAPRGEALVVNGQFFCGAEHARYHSAHKGSRAP